MARADIILAAPNTPQHYNGGGTHYPVQKHGTPATFYELFVDTANDLCYIKSTDGGFTWSNPVVVRAGTVIAFANWYRRWSGIASDKIDIFYTDANSIFYRSLDISTDTLGTETTVFAGASSAGGGSLTGGACRDGTLRVAGSIDAGAEDGAWSSTDDGATWGDTIADPSEGATTDQYYFMPGWNSDQADFMLGFVDASANGLSVKRYDDSGNSWAESAIIADSGFVDVTPATSYPHVAVTVDLANSRNILACWNAADAANQDLRVFVIDDTTITATTADAVLNATDDCALCAIGIDTDTGTWYVFYAGNADGSETWNTAVKVYYKTSTDGGANWSAQTALTDITRSTLWMACVPRFATTWITSFLSEIGGNDLLVASVLLPSGGGGLATGVFGGSVVR
jgi:hypothetical protein